MRCKVLVDDNFHHADESHRYELGRVPTLEAALDAARRIVDEYLVQNHEPGMTAEALLASYKMFGEDPWIVPLAADDAASDFSAWDYAERRCAEICAPQDKSS